MAPRRTPWVHVATAASESEPSKRWEIKRRRADGHLGCACPNYRFAKGSDKTCKHIRAYREANDASVVHRAVVTVTTPTVTVNNETFTVTRAIAFSVLTPD